ncbi:MAG TPA: rhomboid family intramembrane serine protease [Flavobacteriales bacterium]|nr:rhomboid family intramembrane serine protease [Flavobacteriales bacterium]
MELSINLVVMALTVLVSLAAFQDRSVQDRLLFQPYAVQHRGQWYRLLTHAFVHADTMHLVVNMFVLWSFGSSVEKLLPLITPLEGGLAYVLLYVGGAVFATLPGMVKHRDDPNYRSVGASGAVSAVVFAQIVMLPTQRITLFFIQDLPAWLFGGLYLLYSYMMDKRAGDNVAHDAHFYGAVFGVLFTFALRPELLIHFGALERALGI